jgi:hypothetical protein
MQSSLCAVDLEKLSALIAGRDLVSQSGGGAHRGSPQAFTSIQDAYCLMGIHI